MSDEKHTLVRHTDKCLVTVIISTAICSTMIDIIQWCASIGVFNNISVQSVRNACIDNNIRCDSLEFIEYEVPSTHYFPIVWFLSLYYVLNIFFQISLILSGDIETNPGPISHKTCPSCDAHIPIRKRFACVVMHSAKNINNISIAYLCFTFQKSHWYLRS